VASSGGSIRTTLMSDSSLALRTMVFVSCIQFTAVGTPTYPSACPSTPRARSLTRASSRVHALAQLDLVQPALTSLEEVAACIMIGAFQIA
jgi:hypothetical protein